MSQIEFLVYDSVVDIFVLICTEISLVLTKTRNIVFSKIGIMLFSFKFFASVCVPAVKEFPVTRLRLGFSLTLTQY